MVLHVNRFTFKSTENSSSTVHLKSPFSKQKNSTGTRRRNMFRSLLAGENNGHVNKLCGRWSHLAGGRSRQVRFNQKRSVPRYASGLS